MIGFTDKEKMFCEYWLKSYSKLNSDLTHPRFTQFAIKKLISYELQTRRRRKIAVRLLSRLYKLKREAATTKMDSYLKMSNGKATPLFMFMLDKDNDKFLEEGLNEGECN